MLLAALALMGAWGASRATLGIDFGDSAHAVELAVRTARGDVPFRDELNMQVLGSWPAVPVVWVWLHAIGIDGIVLASRLSFVAVVALVVGVCRRAVARYVGRGTAAAALVAAVITTACNQQVLSYNTTPGLLDLLARVPRRLRSAVGRGAGPCSPGSPRCSVPSATRSPRRPCACSSPWWPCCSGARLGAPSPSPVPTRPLDRRCPSASMSSGGGFLVLRHLGPGDEMPSSVESGPDMLREQHLAVRSATGGMPARSRALHPVN
ncbi:hypothetical protein GCM10023258_22840 [Terrabacter aeriphilus]|uniref:Glycosyltransferase RgtA/B/C/D-like domain-containing protein n=1 Tax=Terrabacter aeriphilus TaxID=515662 RepID=A0ABP9JEW4_9MICO